MKILIIEPDVILARHYQKAFNKAGFDVDLCNDAQVAIARIDKQVPDAIVMEIQLAGHSGIEFLHEFRSYEDWSKIPVFIYSNIPEYALGADSKTWSTFGVERYFYKSQTSLTQLIGVLKEALT